MVLQRAAWVVLAIAEFLVGSSRTACAQINTADGGSITTKGTGADVLVVHYFCERSSSSSAGCFRIHVESLAGPSARERNLEVFLYKQGIMNATHSSVAYRIPVTLAEGSSGESVAVPIFLVEELDERATQFPLFTWDVGVFEGGRDVEASRTVSGSAARNNTTPMNRSMGPFRSPPSQHHIALNRSKVPSVLRLLDDSATATAVQPEMFRLFAARTNNIATAQSLTALARDEYGILSDAACACNVRKLSSAPVQWQTYLQYDLIVLEGKSMQVLIADHPEVASALRDYLISGGRMILIDNDSSHPGRQQAVDWLSSPVHSIEARDGSLGDWLGVPHPLADWWSRDFQWISMTSQDGRRRSQSGYLPLPVNVFPMAPASPNDEDGQRQYALQMELAIRRALSVKHERAPKPTLAGCFRDLLIAAKTYQVSTLSSEMGMLQELGLFLRDENDASTYTSAGLGPDALTPLSDSGDGKMNSVSDVNAATDSTESALSAGARLLGLLATSQEWVASGWQSIENIATAMEQKQTENCVVRNFGLGKVAVVHGSLDSVPIDQLSVLCLELNSSSSSGVEASNDRNWYWRNFIDSVGKPPVWVFCALVLLFGILIGPGLLLLTAWIGRRSLLILLVPTLSLAATLLIVSYEVLHEGFATTIRVNSVLAVDEITGRGFAWSRQTYFSGWPSDDGFVFPKSAFFRPVDFSFRERERTEAPSRSARSQIQVDESQWRWVGWLRAREQQQMLLGHPVRSKSPIKVTPVGRNQLSIKNLTAERLPIVLVRDGGDGYYAAENLDPGMEVVCSSQLASELGSTVVRLRAERIATMPDGLRDARWRRNRAMLTTEAEGTGPEILDSIWGDYFSDNLKLPRYGFSTIVRNCDGVHLPTNGTVTECTTLVVGRLDW